MLQNICQSTQPRHVSRTFRCDRTLFQRRCHALQLRKLALAHVRSLCVLDGLLQSCDLVCRQSLRARQLVHVRLRHHQLCRPLNFLLVLHIQLTYPDRFRRVDFVLRQEFARVSSKHVQTRAISEP